MPIARKGRWRVGGELVDPTVPLHQRKQLAELLGKAVADILDTFDTLTGGKATVSSDAPLVLHGEVIPEGIEDGVLHRDIDEPDNHITQIHSFEHNQGERDPLDIGVPTDIGSTNASGGAIDYNDRLHQHRGTRTVHVDGEPEIFGDIVIDGDATQVGNTITVGSGAITPADFVDNENLDAQCDGVTTVFTLAFAPSPAESLDLDVGFSPLGALGSWVQGVHYTLAGVTITKAAGVPIPPAGARMRARYRK